MTAGRDLDVIMVEKVMGWTNLGERWSDNNLSGYRWQKPSGVRLPKEGFQPSVNIVDAWQVVERLVAIGYRHPLVRCDSERPEGTVRWTAAISSHDGARRGRGDAETAPLAICLAALAAVGTSVPA